VDDSIVRNSIVPGFLVQTGDKTGTGAGGESFYGGSFDSNEVVNSTFMTTSFDL